MDRVCVVLSLTCAVGPQKGGGRCLFSAGRGILGQGGNRDGSSDWCYLETGDSWKIKEQGRKQAVGEPKQ